ncbi:MAG: BtaA family protein, partial [Saprospiraceae bacterium]|nr:BtaA family protein [Saprospiraceae bacterium]
VMLTSAGCNALDYLLDGPAEVHCVDLNPRQNALLELKMALLRNSDHATLFRFFGEGVVPDARAVFDTTLRDALAEPFARAYWDRHLSYFSGRGLRRSFYWHGSSGTVAWMIRQWMHTQAGLMGLVEGLFAARSLEEQAYWYEQMEPRFLNRFMQWALQQHFVQSMLGVPKSQQQLAAAYFTDGMAGYFRHCLRRVFLDLPVADNYFWKLYFQGRYSPDCCPNYLRAEYFDLLKARVPAIRTHSSSLSVFLQEHPGAYTHFVLLDHQDWLAAHLKSALEEEWRLILRNAAPGARVLMRSASFEPDFLPDFVQQRVVFDREAAARAQARDRVGTYASTWIGTVESPE